MTHDIPDAKNKWGLLLSDELMFNSRITGTASQLGLSVTPIRSQEDLQRLAREQTPACVIVDLANPGLDIDSLVQNLKSEPEPITNIVAFGSHVDTETLRAARAAGCDLVLPRSKFVEELPKALPGWFGA